MILFVLGPRIRKKVGGVWHFPDRRHRKEKKWRLAAKNLFVCPWHFTMTALLQIQNVRTYLYTHHHTYSYSILTQQWQYYTQYPKWTRRGTYTCDKWPMKFKMIEQNDLTFANWWLVSSFVSTHFKIKCFPLSKNNFFEVVGYSIGSLYVP